MEITLLLTISTCLTIGNGTYVTGSSIDSLKDKADEVLQIAGESNPFFDLVFSAVMSLCSCTKTNKLYTESRRMILSNHVFLFRMNHRVKDSTYC